MSVGLFDFFINNNQESYLTLNPKITYFDAVYKTCCMFAVESIPVVYTGSRAVDHTSFNGFNTVFTYEIPRAGDLMNKIYVEIKLPKIDLTNFNNAANNKMSNKVNLEKNDILEQVAEIYVSVYKKIKTFCMSDNNHDIEKHKNHIIQYIDNNIILNHFYSMIEFDIKDNKYHCVIGIDALNIAKIISSDNINTKNKLFDCVSNLINCFRIVKRYYLNEYDSERKLLQASNKSTDNPLTFSYAWVKKIGYAIINEVIIYIGGQKIDKHTGTWLNIWHELSGSISDEKTFRKMIGDVEYLTDYNNVPKPEYTLQIPLEFWFCRHYASSLPLTSLEYQKVRIELTTSSFNEIFRVIDLSNSIDIQELRNECKTSINPILYVDYIILDKTERKKFACEPQEYIIDELQIYDQNIKTSKFNVNLDYFSNPTKELIWVLEDDWNEYSKINKSTITLYDTTLVEMQGFYFNYIQPYEHHNKTPNKNIYNYSFSINPEELQATGTTNFSIIKGSKILMERFNDENNNKKISNLLVFARSVNVLRFAAGYGSLAFVYG